MIRVLRNGPVIPSARTKKVKNIKCCKNEEHKKLKNPLNKKNNIKNYFDIIEQISLDNNSCKIEMTDDETTKPNLIETEMILTENEKLNPALNLVPQIINGKILDITNDGSNELKNGDDLQNLPTTPHRIKLEDEKRINKNGKLNNVKLTSTTTITEFFPLRRSNRKPKSCVQEEEENCLKVAVLEDKELDLEVRHFNEKGRGVIALREFNRGDYVIEYRGDLIDIAEAREREYKYTVNNITGCYMYYFKYKNRQYCVDATPESPYLGRLVNHSRNGNLMTRIVEINNAPRLVLIAKEHINIGDELTYDYGDRSKESLKHHPWLAY